MEFAKTDHLRLAVALTVLRNKSAEQSISSCLLELYERFPVSKEGEGKTAKETEVDDVWRKRILALEEENEGLKRQIQKRGLDVLASNAGSSMADSQQTQGTGASPKKKRKITSQTVIKPSLEHCTIKSVYRDLISGNNLPALKDSLDILSSFRILQQSDTIPTQSEAFNETLIPNLKRSLIALGSLLDALLSETGSPVPTSSRVPVADSLRNLLISLLGSSLPLGLRRSVLPQVMKELTISVIRPIISGIDIISRRVFRTFDEPGPKVNKIDIRPNLLFILKELLECLRRTKQHTRDMRVFIILEIAKEITRCWSSSSSKSRMPYPEQWINQLSRKDSLWYHCSILHLVLDDLPKSLSNEKDLDVLSAVAVDTLAALPRLLENEKPVDEIAKGMVLAVVEKAWLNGLYVPCEEGMQEMQLA